MIPLIDVQRPDISLLGILGYSIFAFALVLLFTPWFIDFLRRNKVGKQLRVETVDGRDPTIFRSYHKNKFGTPTMGGLLMWGGIVLTVVFSRVLSLVGLVDHSLFQRGEVYLPLFVLISLGLVGGLDDYLNIIGSDAQKIQQLLRWMKKIFLAMAVFIIPIVIFIVSSALWHGQATGGVEQFFGIGPVAVVLWYALFLLCMLVFIFSGLVLDDVLHRFLFGSVRKGGLGVVPKIASLLFLGLVGGLWFYYKLGISSVYVPLLGDFEIGLLYIPFFIFVLMGTANAVNFTDGLDGLAGGLLVIAFGSFAILAYLFNLTVLAAFCGVCVGAIAAFLWHNVPPALFFMGDTGSMALGGTLAVIAMMTNQVAVLPLIGFIFVIEMLSVIIQLLSKKFRGGKKIFRAAPIHHHFEALDWGESKVTMRMWIVGSFVAFLGLVLGIIG